MVRPTAIGDRAIMNMPDKRQLRGVITDIATVENPADAAGPAETRTYANFRDDSGQEHQGIAITRFEKIDDPLPVQPTDPVTDQPKPELAAAVIQIGKVDYQNALRALALTQPIGTVALGGVITSWLHNYQDGVTVVVALVNGEDCPYVDAYLCQGSPENVLAEVPPRQNLEGTYQFDAPGGIYNLEVRAS